MAHVTRWLRCGRGWAHPRSPSRGSWRRPGRPAGPSGCCCRAPRCWPRSRPPRDASGASGAWVLALPAAYVAGVQVVARSLVAGHEPVLLEEHGSLAAAVAALPAGVDGFVSLVPTQLHRALGDPDDTAALRLAAHRAARRRPDRPVAARAGGRAAGVRVVATYGSAETAGGCVYDGVPLDGVGLALGARRSDPAQRADALRGLRRRPRRSPPRCSSTGGSGPPTPGASTTTAACRCSGASTTSSSPAASTCRPPPSPRGCARTPASRPPRCWGCPTTSGARRLVAFVVASGSGLDRLAPPDARRPARLGGPAHPRSWAPAPARRPLPLLPMLANGKPDRVALRGLVAPVRGCRW